MRGHLTILTICAVTVLGLTLRASEKPTEAYQKTMKDMSAANGALRADVKAAEAAGAYPDYMPVEKDAVALKAAFNDALVFWTARKADDAIRVAGSGVKAVDDLTAAIKDKNRRVVAAMTRSARPAPGATHRTGNVCLTCMRIK